MSKRRFFKAQRTSTSRRLRAGWDMQTEVRVAEPGRSFRLLSDPDRCSAPRRCRLGAGASSTPGDPHASRINGRLRVSGAGPRRGRALMPGWPEKRANNHHDYLATRSSSAIPGLGRRGVEGGPEAGSSPMPEGRRERPDWRDCRGSVAIFAPRPDMVSGAEGRQLLARLARPGDRRAQGVWCPNGTSPPPASCPFRAGPRADGASHPDAAPWARPSGRLPGGLETSSAVTSAPAARPLMFTPTPRHYRTPSPQPFGGASRSAARGARREGQRPPSL